MEFVPFCVNSTESLRISAVYKILKPTHLVSRCYNVLNKVDSEVSVYAEFCQASVEIPITSFSVIHLAEDFVPP